MSPLFFFRKNGFWEIALMFYYRKFLFYNKGGSYFVFQSRPTDNSPVRFVPRFFFRCLVTDRILYCDGFRFAYCFKTKVAVILFFSRGQLTIHRFGSFLAFSFVAWWPIESWESQSLKICYKNDYLLTQIQVFTSNYSVFFFKDHYAQRPFEFIWAAPYK